jgi:pimeloyl-ACP methyl ester carboxylesterase
VKRRYKLLVLLLLPLATLAAGIRPDRPAAEVEARRAAPPSQFVVVDGLRVHYRDRGQGPVMVLLHGSNASLFTWEGWAQRLAVDHRVIALDLPGHGLTGPDAKHRYRAQEMAELLERFVAQLGLSHFTLAGNSMGGHVAWRYTLAHPERVDHLVLVDAAGLPRDEPVPFAFRVMSTPGLSYIGRWVTPHFLIARTLRDAYADPTRITEADVDLYEDLLLREGNREATRERFAGHDDPATAQRLGEIKAPTLILWGERDRWILPKYGEHFHDAIAGSRLVMLPGVGHPGMEEAPDATVAQVRKFLEETR